MTPSSLSSNTFPIRRNVRLVLLSECDELLLMKIALPDRSFWCTIGGGIEAQETPEQAVYREASEEIGLNQAALSLGPTIWQGEHLLERNGVLTLHQEQFILARTRRQHFGSGNMTEEEKTVVKAFRWWPLSELKSSSEFIVPPSLVRHLEPVLANQIPSQILTIALGDNPDEAQAVTSA